MQISNFKLAIGVPCSYDFVHKRFWESYARMKKPDHELIVTGNGPVDGMRNNIVKRAQLAQATHLLMMDTDQIYHEDTINALLSRKKPVVGAAVCRRYPPFDPIILKSVEHSKSVSGYVSSDEWDDNGMVECDATGCGCILFEMSVFKHMDNIAQKKINAFNAARPDLKGLDESERGYIQELEKRCVHTPAVGEWFKFRRQGEGLPSIGEDIGFCQDLKAAGYQIFVDTSVPAGHMTTLVVDRKFHLLYNEMAKHNQNKKVEIAKEFAEMVDKKDQEKEAV